MTELARLLESVRLGAANLLLTSSLEGHAYPFMMDVLELGLAIEAEPSLRAGVVARLDETAPHLGEELESFTASLEISSRAAGLDGLTNSRSGMICVRGGPRSRSSSSSTPAQCLRLAWSSSTKRSSTA
jgi:hypothetical protein